MPVFNKENLIMKKMLFLFIMVVFLSSQYILERGIYIGGNGSYTVPFLFQSNTENKDLNSKSFRGVGKSFGFSLLFKADKRNYLGLDINLNMVKIEHNSIVFADSLSSMKTEKDEFHLIRLFYVKKFENNPLFISGGLEAHLPKKTTSIEYIKDPLKRAQGYAAIGLVFGTDRYNLMPYTSYSFPLSKYKAKNEIELNYGEFNLGLKFYLKLF